MPDSTRPTPSSLLSRVPLFWQLQLAGWGTFAVLSLPIKQVAFGSLASALLVTTCQLPLGLALSLGLRRFYHWTQPTRKSFAPAAMVVLAACAVAGTLDAVLSTRLNSLLDIPQSELVGDAMYFFRAAIYLMWSLGYFVIKAQLQTREQAFQAAVAEEKHRLELLRYQLNPHFLAESLKAISQEITEKPAAAHAMTQRLADFYQSMLRQSSQDRQATLGDEIALVRAYLQLEQLRQREALRVDFVIDESLLRLPLPPVVLLPLVEKAVRQSRGTPTDPLTITITVQRQPGNTLLLEVANSRRPHGTQTPFSQPAAKETVDIRPSLDRHYPGLHRLTLSQDSLSERATLCLPLAGG